MFPLTLRYVLRTTQGAWKRKKSTRRVYTFFCLDTKETKNQGTGLLLGSETIFLN
jgi:hypothetical protein